MLNDSAIKTWNTNQKTVQLYHEKGTHYFATVEEQGKVEKLGQEWIQGLPEARNSEEMALALRDTYLRIGHDPIGGIAQIWVTPRCRGGMEEEGEIEVFKEDTINGIYEGIQVAEKVRDKDIIAIVGVTGSGKSTVVNILSDKAVVVQTDQLNEKYLVNADLNAPIRIGNGVQACTFYPNIISVNQGSQPPLKIVDCGGFLDNRGPQTEAVVTSSVKFVLENASKVKLFLCATHASIDPSLSDNDTFVNTMSNLYSRLLKDYDAHKEGLVLIVTKPRPYPDEGGMPTPQTIAQDLRGLLEENRQGGAQGLHPQNPVFQLIERLSEDNGRHIIVSDPTTSEGRTQLKTNFTGILNRMQWIDHPRGAFNLHFNQGTLNVFRSSISSLIVELDEFYSRLSEAETKVKDSEEKQSRLSTRITSLKSRITKLRKKKADTPASSMKDEILELNQNQLDLETAHRNLLKEKEDKYARRLERTKNTLDELVRKKGSPSLYRTVTYSDREERQNRTGSKARAIGRDMKEFFLGKTYKFEYEGPALLEGVKGLQKELEREGQNGVVLKLDPAPNAQPPTKVYWRENAVGPKRRSHSIIYVVHRDVPEKRKQIARDASVEYYIKFENDPANRALKEKLKSKKTRLENRLARKQTEREAADGRVQEFEEQRTSLKSALSESKRQDREYDRTLKDRETKLQQKERELEETNTELPGLKEERDRLVQELWSEAKAKRKAIVRKGVFILKEEKEGHDLFESMIKKMEKLENKYPHPQI